MKLPEGYVPGVGLVKTKGGFGGFGQKMLERMGWERGQGLGKDKAGRKDAIEVAKKENTLGVSARAGQGTCTRVCASRGLLLLQLQAPAAASRPC